MPAEPTTAIATTTTHEDREAAVRAVMGRVPADGPDRWDTLRWLDGKDTSRPFFTKRIQLDRAATELAAHRGAATAQAHATGHAAGVAEERERWASRPRTSSDLKARFGDLPPPEPISDEDLRAIAGPLGDDPGPTGAAAGTEAFTPGDSETPLVDAQGNERTCEWDERYGCAELATSTRLGRRSGLPYYVCAEHLKIGEARGTFAPVATELPSAAKVADRG